MQVLTKAQKVVLWAVLGLSFFLAACTYSFDNPAEIVDQTALDARIEGVSKRAERVFVQLYIEPDNLESWTAQRIVVEDEKTVNNSSVAEFEFTELPSGTAQIVVQTVAGATTLQVATKDDVVIKQGKKTSVLITLPEDSGGDIDYLDFEQLFPEEQEITEPEEINEQEPEFAEAEEEEESRFKFEVYYHQPPQLDGYVNRDEWPERFYEVNDGTTQWQVRFSHSDNNLYMLIKVLNQNRSNSGDAVIIGIDPEGDASGDDFYMLTFVLSGSGAKLCTPLVENATSCGELPRPPDWDATYRQAVLGYIVEIRIGLGTLGIMTNSDDRAGIVVRFQDSGKTSGLPQDAKMAEPQTYALLVSPDNWSAEAPEEETEPETEVELEIADGDADTEFDIEQEVVESEPELEIVEEQEFESGTERTEGELEEEQNAESETQELEETSEIETEQEADAETVCVPNSVKCELRGSEWFALQCNSDGTAYINEQLCDDYNPCTDNSCIEDYGCYYQPNDNPCDDGNACTLNDVCSGGICVGEPKQCDDNNPCTNDSCNQLTGECSFEPLPEGTSCDDGDPCTVGDYCNDQGVCVSGETNPNCCPGHPEMVLVHNGSTQYCIDKFEAVVMQNSDCTGTAYGINSDDYPSGFPDDVGYTSPQTEPVYACSIESVIPSAYITLYQARKACENSGKRLCTEQEWQIACGNGNASQSYPYGNSYNALACNGADYGQAYGSMQVRTTGSAEYCTGSLGIYDMSGNLWEWTDAGTACGGYYSSSQAELMCNSCDVRPPSASSMTRGFRCCLDYIPQEDTQ